MTPLPTLVRGALAAALPGLNAEVRPGPVAYEQGLPRSRYEVTVLTGPIDDTAAQERLDELLAPDGLKATLEADRTLGGLVSDIDVAKCTGWQAHKGPAGEAFIGATWTVQTL